MWYKWKQNVIQGIRDLTVHVFLSKMYSRRRSINFCPYLVALLCPSPPGTHSWISLLDYHEDFTFNSWVDKQAGEGGRRLEETKLGESNSKISSKMFLLLFIYSDFDFMKLYYQGWTGDAAAVLFFMQPRLESKLTSEWFLLLFKSQFSFSFFV